jgi:DNA replication protein DnaC
MAPAQEGKQHQKKENQKMIDEQTIAKMNELKLFGMAKGFLSKVRQAGQMELSHSEFTGLLIDDEKIDRENRKMSRMLKNAKLRQQASLEQVDYTHSRGLSKQVIVELNRSQWLSAQENVCITGATGLGKSWLACALGNQACRAGYSTLYVRVPRLFEQLHISRADGTHFKLLGRLAKTQVLILDDFGLSKMTEVERKDLLEIAEDRYGSGSTIITSQFSTKDWHQLIGEPTIADAILDRIFHNAHKIELKGGESIRKNKSKKPENDR